MRLGLRPPSLSSFSVIGIRTTDLEGTLDDYGKVGGPIVGTDYPILSIHGSPLCAEGQRANERR